MQPLPLPPLLLPLQSLPLPPPLQLLPLQPLPLQLLPLLLMTHTTSPATAAVSRDSYSHALCHHPQALTSGTSPCMPPRQWLGR